MKYLTPEGYIIVLTESDKKEVATICGNPKIKFSLYKRVIYIRII